MACFSVFFSKFGLASVAQPETADRQADRPADRRRLDALCSEVGSKVGRLERDAGRPGGADDTQPKAQGSPGLVQRRQAIASEVDRSEEGVQHGGRWRGVQLLPSVHKLDEALVARARRGTPDPLHVVADLDAAGGEGQVALEGEVALPRAGYERVHAALEDDVREAGGIGVRLSAPGARLSTIGARLSRNRRPIGILANEMVRRG
jgi:hypothetical protein